MAHRNTTYLFLMQAEFFNTYFIGPRSEIFERRASSDLRSDLHAHDVGEEYAADLSVTTGYDYLTVFDRHASDSAHRTID